MADSFTGEIRVFSFPFAPVGWAFCDGALIPIQQNPQLFSLLGNLYGGNGNTTFAVPDLRGSVALGQGQGAGLSERDLGATGGAASVTLTVSEIANHTHQLQGAEIPATDTVPSPSLMLAQTQGTYAPPANLVQAWPGTIYPAGSGMAHNNLQPFLAMNFCISLQGIFPPRG